MWRQAGQQIPSQQATSFFDWRRVVLALVAMLMVQEKRGPNCLDMPEGRCLGGEARGIARRRKALEPGIML